jgi:hypothetical protein
MNKKPICLIANEIRREWKNVNYAAQPYLSAMLLLSSVNDSYGYDSASSVIRYFLSNASSFRGDKAKELKNELKLLLKN